MTNDQSDFTQGSILKETGNFYDAGLGALTYRLLMER